MKSKASLGSHPVHPMLVGFPIAFFFGAFLFDLLALLFRNPLLHTTAFYLVIAGIVGGVLAAVPGIIDFLHTVPPNSSAKKRAAKHGLLNTTNLLLFVAVFFIRRGDEFSMALVIVMEALGLGIMSYAGWLGGTLVYRNQIGVDHRYANAGKWKEVHLPAEDLPVKVADLDELQIDQMKLVHIGGKRIVVARSEEGYAAFSDFCTHRGASLAGGAMICGTVHCPWHGSQFSVWDGAVKAGPAKKPIETFNLQQRDGAIYLESLLPKK
jgi:uncharacterized membrane protein/nitrite reductase/ring-hydroxylating ferredoxin subunit